jgi:hypothetical protein
MIRDLCQKVEEEKISKEIFETSDGKVRTGR